MFSTLKAQGWRINLIYEFFKAVMKHIAVARLHKSILIRSRGFTSALPTYLTYLFL